MRNVILNIVGVGLGVIAFIAFIIYTPAYPPKPPKCLEAPEIVNGWHTVTGRPDDGYVCGWHQAGVVEPVYRCVRMKACTH